MDEYKFSEWFKNQNFSRKTCSDCISRLKRLEHTIKDCDIEEEYYKDECESLMSLFKNQGINKKMTALQIGELPIGKPYLATYKYAIKKYVSFMNYKIS